MKIEEVIEIADEIYMSPPRTNSAEERIVALCNEIERRALERAAVVCEEMFSDGALVIADAIRALKEEVK